MGDVLQFTPRPKPFAPAIPAPLSGPALRAGLEEAAQVALDAADRIIAVLDRMDGDTDLEDGADAEPSLAAPENATGSQVVYMRGGYRDGGTEAPETVLPEKAAEATLIHVEPLRWGGRGNVVAAVGAALLDVVAGQG